MRGVIVGMCDVDPLRAVDTVQGFVCHPQEIGYEDHSSPSYGLARSPANFILMRATARIDYA